MDLDEVFGLGADEMDKFLAECDLLASRGGSKLEVASNSSLAPTVSTPSSTPPLPKKDADAEIDGDGGSQMRKSKTSTDGTASPMAHQTLSNFTSLSLKSARLRPDNDAEVSSLPDEPDSYPLSIGTGIGSIPDDPIVVGSSSPGPGTPPEDILEALSSLKRKRNSSDSPLSTSSRSRTKVNTGIVQSEPRSSSSSLPRPRPPSAALYEDGPDAIVQLLKALSITMSPTFMDSVRRMVVDFDGSSRLPKGLMVYAHSKEPLVITREALETILPFLVDNAITSIRGSQVFPPNTFRLGSMIARARLDRVTILVFHDLPGGKLKYAHGEHFPADKTVRLLRAAHEALNSASSSTESRPLCPKATKVVLQQTAAQDLFNYSHVAMDFLNLLAAPKSLCLDFDLSFTADDDIVFDISIEPRHKRRAKVAGYYDTINDMSPERGVVLGSFINSVWPSIEVVNFHQGAGKTLPYCGIPISHNVYCGATFDQSLTVAKRLVALTNWQEDASAVVFKEVLRVEASDAVKEPKGKSSQRKESQSEASARSVSVMSAAKVAVSTKATVDTRPPWKRPTWATINAVWAAEEAAASAPKPAAKEPAVVSLPQRNRQEAHWVVHIGDSFNRSSKTIEDEIAGLVAQLVEVRDARERKAREAFKIRSKAVKKGGYVEVEVHNKEVFCGCCQSLW